MEMNYRHVTSKSQLLVLSDICSIDLMTEYTNSWDKRLVQHIFLCGQHHLPASHISLISRNRINRKQC